MKTLALAFSLLLPLACGVLADKPKQEDVERELRSLIAAYFRADIAPIMKYTHERMLAGFGDEEAFRAELAEVKSQAESFRVKFVSADIGEEIDYFAGKENEFFLVETTVVVVVGDKKHRMGGPWLGVKKKTVKGWKYIDCTSLTTELAREWFSDFPKDKKIPKPRIP